MFSFNAYEGGGFQGEFFETMVASIVIKAKRREDGALCFDHTQLKWRLPAIPLCGRGLIAATAQ
jgi:hypothetical protein